MSPRSRRRATGISFTRRRISRWRFQVEASELLEEFQWLTEEQSRSLDPERRERVRLEMADVLIYLLRLADKLDVDLLARRRRTSSLSTSVKYPADRVRGDARKYTEY